MFALKQLHSRNIIHRDIKLDNILYTKENGQIIFKLGDFGVSKKLKLDEINEEQTHVGTGHYLPPEDKENNGKFESQIPEIDMYSLGISMFDICLENVLNKVGKFFKAKSYLFIWTTSQIE